MEPIINLAIKAVQTCELSYCKYLSANDTKLTKAHQAGYLVSKSAWKMFFEREPLRGENLKTDVTIKWQNEFETSSVFTYYGAAKNEFRLTGFGRNFPFREESNTGDLFILCKQDKAYFNAFILSHDEEIEDFFAAVNISSVETNKIIQKQEQRAEDNLILCFNDFINSLTLDFPSTFDLAKQARVCYNSSFKISANNIKNNPDKEILNWLNSEFQLFKTIENNRYSERIKTPFKSVEELVEIANSILNRRKSRAGKSLEHHLEEIFKTFELKFSTQAITEDRKKPDFIFPDIESYNNPKFNEKKIIILASKTTCKDRWRQILNEADRVKTKHLFTLQQGISKSQLEEMYKYNVCLVVPKPYLTSFPEDFKSKILTLESFANYVSMIQKT